MLYSTVHACFLVCVCVFFRVSVLVFGGGNQPRADQAVGGDLRSAVEKLRYEELLDVYG